MQYRTLGRTGLKVSCIGIGGIPLAGMDIEQASKVLNTALDHGINFVDTARGYKESEELIGTSISSRKNEFYIATKTRARKEKSIQEELKKSLKNLKINTLDLYQIHYVNTPEELKIVMKKGGALEVLKKLRDQKVIRFIGITGHSSRVLMQAAQTGEFDTIQGAFSYIEKEQETVDLIHQCSGRNLGFIVQKPLAGGAITLASVALKWLLRHPVSTVIPGMVSVSQVEENCSVVDGELSLTTEEMESLDELVKKLEGDFCRRCYYCHPVCPEKIRIGVILEFYGKAKFPENLELARRWYSGYTVNATNCTECGLCLPECPYNLPIIDMLKKAHQLLG